MTVKQLANRLGVNATTLRVWEGGHQPVPAGRHDDLVRLLEPPATGSQLRLARVAAGWSLIETARRLSARGDEVSFSRVSHWELDDQPIPLGRRAAVSSVLTEALDAAGRHERLEADVERVVAWVTLHPGKGLKTVLHQNHRDGSEGTARWRTAVSEAIASMRVVEVLAAEPDRRGRPRRIKRCYVPSAVPLIVVSMTGDELRSARQAQGLSRAELARSLGVSSSAVLLWERREKEPIPHWHVDAILAALKAAPPSDRSAREQVLVTVAAHPGIPRYRVLAVVGYGSAIVAALEDLLAEGLIVAAACTDSMGRSYPGLWSTGSVPTPGPALRGDELRQLRLEAGLRQVELAEAVGVSPSKMSTWETGARRIPAGRVEQLHRALIEPRPWPSPTTTARAEPLEAVVASFVEQVRAGPQDGLAASRLRPLPGPRTPRATAALRRAIADGQLHHSWSTTELADGRSYRRQVLRAGPADDPARPGLRCNSTSGANR